jgi:hypothetical protein
MHQGRIREYETLQETLNSRKTLASGIYACHR